MRFIFLLLFLFVVSTSFAQPKGNRSTSAQRKGNTVVSTSVPSAPQNEDAATTSTTGAFANYKEIIEKNIFDPNRRPVSHTAVVAVATPDPQGVVTSSRFALVGIMIQDEQAQAFFKGTPSTYDGSYKLNSTFGVFKLAGIFTDRIILLLGNTKYELSVGQQLEERGGQWIVTAYIAPASAAPPIPTPAPVVVTPQNTMGIRGNNPFGGLPGFGGMPQPGGQDDNGNGFPMPPGFPGMGGPPGENNAPPGEAAAVATPTSTPASGAAAARPAGSSAGSNDVLKRLMERRQRGE